MPSSSTARRRADARERSMRSLDNAIDRRMRSVSHRIGIDIIRARSRGDQIASAIASLSQRLSDAMEDAMATYHMLGRLHVLQEAQPRVTRGIAADRLGAARRFLATRLDLSPGEIESLRAMYGAEAIRIALQLATSVSDIVEEAVQDAVAEGDTTKAATGRIRDRLKLHGVTGVQPYRLETLFRTSSQMAFSAGEWNADQDPAIQEILWGYEYVTVGDDRVRPEHAALDGVRLPKGSEAWSRIMPPNGYNCRCTVVRIFQGDPDAKLSPVPEVASVKLNDGSTTEVRNPGADRGFEFNPGRVFRDALGMKAGLSAAMSSGASGRMLSLVTLAIMGGEATQRQIAEHTGKAPSTISANVAKLSRDGLVKHQNGARGVKITPKGWTAAGSMVN